jgi:hypothetical protein
VIYPVLDDARDRITKESRSSTATAQANPEHVSDFFNRVENDPTKKDTPAPPNPQQ